MEYQNPRDRLKLMNEFKEKLDQSLNPPANLDETSEEAYSPASSKKKNTKRQASKIYDI